MAPVTREHLAAVLRRRPMASAPALAAELRVSVPTVQRLLRAAGDSVVSRGRARRTRHAWRRGLRGQAVDVPVYRIDADGRAQPFAALALAALLGTAMAVEGTHWPPPDAPRDGWRPCPMSPTTTSSTSGKCARRWHVPTGPRP